MALVDQRRVVHVALALRALRGLRVELECALVAAARARTLGLEEARHVDRVATVARLPAQPARAAAQPAMLASPLGAGALLAQTRRAQAVEERVVEARRAEAHELHARRSRQALRVAMLP